MRRLGLREHITDFGTDGVIDRFGQIEPTVLLSVPDYAYNGKRHDWLVGSTRSFRRCHLFGIDRRGARVARRSSRHRSRSCRCRSLHPWYVLCPSGTTGKPKCIVHRTGVLLKHLTGQAIPTSAWRPAYHDRGLDDVELACVRACYRCDVRLFGLLTYPDANRLFDLADEVGVIFGTSAKLTRRRTPEFARPTPMISARSARWPRPVRHCRLRGSGSCTIYQVRSPPGVDLRGH